MIAKAKVISHGANAIRYSVDKDKAEIVKTNLLPDDISPTAMWARMLALQKKFEDKLNRYHPYRGFPNLGGNARLDDGGMAEVGG